MKLTPILIFLINSIFLFSQDNLIKEIELLDDSLKMNISNVHKQRIYDSALLKLKRNHGQIKLKHFYFEYTLNGGFNRVQTGDVNDSLIESVEFTLKELDSFKGFRSDSLIFKYNLLLSYLNVVNGNLASSKSILNKLLKVKWISNDQKSSVFSELSFLYSIENNLDSSIFFIDKAILLDNVAQNRKRAILNYYTKGEVYLQHKDYFHAYLSYKKALIICKNDYLKIRASIYNRIAFVYSSIEDYNQALFYAKRSLLYHGNDFFLTSEINCDIAAYYAKIKNWDSCFHYSNKIIRSKHENCFNFNTRAYLYRYQYYTFKNKNKNADYALVNARKFNLSTEKDYFDGLINFFYAKKFFNEGDMFKANNFIDSALRYDFSSSNNSNYINGKDVYELAAQIKVEQGDFRSSNFYLQKLIELYKESLVTSTKSKIDNLNFRNQIKRQKEQFLIHNYKTAQKRSKTIVIIGLSAFLIVMNLAYLSYIWLGKRNTKMLQLRQKISQAQIAPHFFANALMGVQKMILEKKTLEASDMVSDFSVLSSLLLQNVRETRIPLSKEILFLEKYVFFQQARKKNFLCSIKIDQNLNTDNILIPPLVTQPFIENAIEHGFKNSDFIGELIVEYLLNSKYLLITISDNGIGMKQSDLHKTYSYSYRIISERIYLFGKILKKSDFELELKSEIDKGTSVFIKIPYEKLS